MHGICNKKRTMMNFHLKADEEKIPIYYVAFASNVTIIRFDNCARVFSLMGSNTEISLVYKSDYQPQPRLLQSRDYAIGGNIQSRY